MSLSSFVVLESENLCSRGAKKNLILSAIAIGRVALLCDGGTIV